MPCDGQKQGHQEYPNQDSCCLKRVVIVPSGFISLDIGELAEAYKGSRPATGKAPEPSLVVTSQRCDQVPQSS